MAVSAGVAETAAGAPRYARFSRRLRAMAIDFILFLAAMVVALQVAVALNSSDLAQVIGFSFVAGFFLYEPLLVWIFGGTVGHYFSNLRVVDDRTHGNVSLPKAVARVIIKAVLGLYSFISMAAARRHQALHDLLTRSTVQIRDHAKAQPSHYSRERVELSGPGMPSGARRIAVIVLYLLGSFVLLALVAGALMDIGVRGRFRDSVVGLLAVVVWTLCIGRGWQGRLWGARRRVESA